MRYTDWDIQLYQSGISRPFQEFRTTCAGIDNALGRMPVVSAWIASLPQGTEYFASVHNWADPKSDKPNSHWCISVTINGIHHSTDYFVPETIWPIAIGKNNEFRSSASRLKFPAFDANTSMQETMSAYQELGCIRFRIIEGLVSNETGKAPRFQPTANVATFSWVYGPLALLQMKNIAWPNPSMFRTANVQQPKSQVSTSSGLMLPPPRPSARVNHIPERRNSMDNPRSSLSASDNSSLPTFRDTTRNVPAAGMPQSNTNNDFIAGFRRGSKPFSDFQYDADDYSGLRAILDQRRRAAGLPPATRPGERSGSMSHNVPPSLEELPGTFDPSSAASIAGSDIRGFKFAPSFTPSMSTELFGGQDPAMSMNSFGNGGISQMPAPPTDLSNERPFSSAPSSMPAIRGNAAMVPSMLVRTSSTAEENQYGPMTGNPLHDQDMSQSPIPLTTPTMTSFFPSPSSSMLSYPGHDPMLPSMPASPSPYPIGAKRTISGSFSDERPNKVNKTDHTKM